MSNVLNDNVVTMYVVKINGVAVSPQMSSAMMAEHWLLTNGPLLEGKGTPMIVPVTQGGQEVLLG